MVEHVIWDWNGTLLNDANFAVSIMNSILSECSLPLLDLARYRAIFGFPVQDYYDQLGFEPHHPAFRSVADQFIQRYESRATACQLHENARPTLAELERRGVGQTLLSAAERGSLRRQVVDHGLDGFFDAVLGVGDHYARGKTAVGREWFRSSGLDPTRTLFIGDTVHDFEVAQAVGVECVLVSNGHQSKQRLEEMPCPVIDSLDEMVARVWG